MSLKISKTYAVTLAIFAGISVFGFANSAKAACSATNPGTEKLTTGTGVVLYWNKDCGPDPTNPWFAAPIDGLTQLDDLGKNPLTTYNISNPNNSPTQETWGDKTSSLVIKGDVSAFFYANASEEGDSICWNGSSIDPTQGIVNDLRSLGWNDRISSIITKGSGQCTNPGLTIKSAYSCSVSNISGCLKNIFNFFTDLGAAILDSVVQLIASATQALAKLVVGILNPAVTYFISVPVSPSSPQAPAFIQNAWNFTRTLTNEFFILILALIGLATIFRIQAYAYQKLLPVLIGVALLINFSGVFVGAIVDVCNLVTRYFLDVAHNPQWNIGNIPTIGGADAPARLGFHVMEIIYYFISTIIYFTIVLLFAMRTLVLWTLSIIAPVAFGMYILPVTKKYYNEWWKLLMEWALLGIPISFFMFLASMVLRYGATPGVDSGTKGTWENLLAPFTVLFLLATGIGMSISLAPAGAKGIINFGKKTGLGAYSFAGRQTLARMLATKTGSNIAKNLAKSNLGVGFEKKLGRARFLITPAMAGLRWGLRQTGKQALQYGVQQTQNIDKEVSNLEKKYGKNYEAVAATYKTTGFLDYEKKIAMAQYLTKTKGGKAFAELDPKEQQETIKLTARYNPSKLGDVVKHAPHLLNDTIKDKQGNEVDNREISDTIQKTVAPKGLSMEDADVKAIAMRDPQIMASPKEWLLEVTRKKLADAISTSDIPNTDKSALDDEAFRKTIARYKPWNFIQKISEEWGAEMVKKLQDDAEKIGLQAIAQTNPTFLRAFETPAGSILMRQFIDPNKNQPLTGKENINQFIRQAQEEGKAIEKLAETKLANGESLLKYFSVVQQIAKLEQEIKRGGATKPNLAEAQRKLNGFKGEQTKFWDTQIKNTSAQGVWEEFEKMKQAQQSPQTP